jgi:predicted GNAT family N-acyltransferase/uncharacterized RDD family membrane protein YckC
VFRVVTSRADLLRCFVVRSIVFVGEQRCPVDEEFDGLDAGAIHVLGEEAGEPVATGRIRNVDGWAKLERIAVLQPARGRQLGHGIVEFMLDVARQRGCRNFKMHAQAHLVTFYRQHGFEPRGEMFREAGIDHYLMVKGDAPLAAMPLAEPAAGAAPGVQPALEGAPGGTAPAAAATPEATPPPPSGIRPGALPSISPTPYTTDFGVAGTPGPHGYLHPELEYVGFGLRLVATLVDGLIIALATWPILIGFYGESYLGSTGYAGPLDFMLTFILPSLATILFWILRGATPGKMLVGARIVDARTGGKASAAQCIGRYFAYFISGFALFIGFMWIAVEPHKQGWHDKLATTLVVRARRHAVPVEFSRTGVRGTATPSEARAADDWLPF